MEVTEVDERYRITIPKQVRDTFKVTKGQKFYVMRHGENLMLKPIPKDAAERLGQLIGNFEFDRKSRKKAEEWLLKQVRE